MKPARLARGLVAPLLAVCVGSTAPHPGIARASYVVMIVMENRDYHPIIGSSQAPYINGTLVPKRH